MSDDRYPFGSDYPSAPPTYPKTPDPPVSGSLPSPVLPPTASYPMSTYRSPDPFAPAQPYGPPVSPYGRPPAPGIALTLVITLFFNLFGLIPAFMHSEEAKRNGYPTSKYWVTFGVVLGAQILLAMVFFLLVVVGFALLT